MPTHPGARRRLFLAVLHVFALAALASAQTLPFRGYAVSEGLANNRVNHVFQDSRGYLWFRT